MTKKMKAHFLYFLSFAAEFGRGKKVWRGTTLEGNDLRISRLASEHLKVPYGTILSTKIYMGNVNANVWCRDQL